MINHIKRTIKYVIKHIAKSSNVSEYIHNSHIKNLLVVLPGGIGNTILANTAIQNMKNSLLDTRLWVLYKQKPVGELVSIWDLFEDDIFYEEKMTLIKKINFLMELRKIKLNAVIIFFPNVENWLRLIFFLAGIPLRIGFDLPSEYCRDGWAGLFLTHPVFYDNKIPEFRNNFKLLDKFEINIDCFCSFKVKKFETNELKVDVKKLNIGMHIGRSNKIKPGWPPEKFIDMINLFKKKYKNSTIYIFGGREEYNISNFVNKHRIRDVENCIGFLGLAQTIYYISLMKLFISNDTGLMHIAASQGVPLVAIFGNTDQIKSRPMVVNEEKLTIISRKLPCQPCYRNKPMAYCMGRVDCLRDITAVDVMESIDHFITASIFK